MIRLTSCIVGAFTALAAWSLGAAQAQGPERRQNDPGKFDFYVLALSWSPSFCEASERPPAQQCGGRPFSFVVHGLWPQYEKGHPEYCQVPAPRLDRNIVNMMLDLMPAPRLVYHEWDKHGTCSGLGARAFFETVRKARAAVRIPEAYLELKAPLTVSPAAVEDAFVAANKSMTMKGIAVRCDNRRLREVWVCLSRDLQFRDCDEVDRRACRRDKLVMPPLRGG